MELYTFEIQLPYAPGCGWLRAPYVRPTFDDAMKEATQYAENAARNGQYIAIRVYRLKDDQITPADIKIWNR